MEITYRKIQSEPVSPYAGFRGTYVEYEVLVDGEHIGNVWNFRATGGANSQGRAGGYANNSVYGHGRWAWQADLAPEAEYATRSEAVSDMLGTWQRRVAS